MGLQAAQEIEDADLRLSRGRGKQGFARGKSWPRAFDFRLDWKLVEWTLMAIRRPLGASWLPQTGAAFIPATGRQLLGVEAASN